MNVLKLTDKKRSEGGTNMKKRVFSILLSLAMALTLLPTAALAAASADVDDTATGARSATLTNTNTNSGSYNQSSVFLGNGKMELGINQCGSFGTTAGSVPSNFHGGRDSSAAIGLRSSPWDATADYFLPGRVDEGFVFAWSTTDGATASQQAYVKSSDKNSVICSNNYAAYATTDDSTASLLKATTSATVAGSVSYTQTVSFASDAGVATVNIELQNNGTSTLYNFEYLRGFDPDQGYYNNGLSNNTTYTTNNYFCTDENGTVWVIASTNSDITGSHTFDEFTAAAKSPFFFIAPKSSDYTVIPLTQAVGWSGYSSFQDVTASSGTYKLGSSAYADQGIGLRFKVGELAAGKSVTLTYYMSLDSNTESALTNINNFISSSGLGEYNPTDSTYSYVVDPTDPTGEYALQKKVGGDWVNHPRGVRNAQYRCRSGHHRRGKRARLVEQQRRYRRQADLLRDHSLHRGARRQPHGGHRHRNVAGRRDKLHNRQYCPHRHIRAVQQDGGSRQLDAGLSDKRENAEQY